MAEKPTFMFIDDDVIVHLYFEGTIREIGADVNILKAHDGQEALDILSLDDTVMPDVIFLDIIMPGLDGYTFLEEFTREFPNARTSVIMVSSSQLEADKERCAAFRCVKEFITKPPKAEDIKHICRAHGAL